MSNLVFIGNSHLDQFNLYPYIKIIYERGASIKGLVNPKSRLLLKDTISKFIDTNPDHTLIYFLGQVDIEFGYYYKCIVDDIKYNINEYYDDIIEKYEKYLQTLTCNFYILSINPTTITNTNHIFNICFRCNNGKDGFYSEKNDNYTLTERVKDILNDSYEKRFLNNKLFNDKLESMCFKNNYKYIDFWEVLVDNNKVNKQYMPLDNDHHLKVVEGNLLLDYILYKINCFKKIIPV